MKTLDDQQRATLLDRLFRRLGKLDDNNLIQLEMLTRAAESGSGLTLPPSTGPRKADTESVSRRYFLASLFAGGILAASAGGAAAVALYDDGVRGWLRDQGWLPTQTALPPTVTPGPSPIPTLPAEALNQIAGLQAQLAAITAERDGLRQQITAANGQLTTLQSTNQHSQDLLGLYRQLEQTNLDDIIVGALAALGIPVAAIEAIQVALSSGVVLAVRILQSIEDQMPLIAAGLDWLDQQVSTLAQGLQTLQGALEASTNTPITRAVADFTSTVLDLLPFGVGTNIKRSLQVMGELVAKLPELLTNVSVRVLEPARAWIVAGKVGGLHDILLRPVREQVLNPAQQMVANAQNLNSVYNNQLAQPAQSALVERAKIRAEITKKAGALPG